ncbi:MAG: 4-(cytidine 5'-diphospho)-2-C-methyl-D-erythritol kinase [Actinobacteria bacterium]|nr:MAG: 4-(cytidine 5'-diphospho)-2-C-methyl-D-erythritol kinase [Actinomycetota bacterium]
MISAKAYAKINLYLAVVGVRPDGYHEIETVFQSVDVADDLLFELSPKLDVVCSVPELSGPRNVAFVAAERLREEEGVTAGAVVRINKRIPVAAGLAGGSADAAATLLGLNRLWGLDLPVARLAQIAARIGADIPFCLTGGTSFGTGTGAELVETGGLSCCWLVLAKPPGRLLASDVYSAFDSSPVQPARPGAALRAVLDVDDTGRICALIENVLDPIVTRLVPEVEAVKEVARKAGACCALVSGSGPTVFCIATSRDEAEGISKSVSELCDFVRVVRPVDRGVVLSEA